MSMMCRLAFAGVMLTSMAAAAQDAVPAPTPPPVPTAPPAAPNIGTEASATTPPDADAGKPKEPKRGDFDAGGQVRLPSGPDEMGKFATFNWVAVDLKARYYLLKSVTVNGNIPVALIKPDSVGMNGPSPSAIGGMSVRLDAKLPTEGMPFASKFKGTEIGLSMTLAYMREGAMLLSEKDYPLFLGDFKPGIAGGLITKVKLGKTVDFSLLPSYVYQSGSAESLTAIQVPMSLILSVGKPLQLSADLGVFTGDNLSLKGKNGGRIATGASVTLKVGPIVTHVGAGVASLLTGGLYPTVKDSVYLDVNVKYAK